MPKVTDQHTRSNQESCHCRPRQPARAQALMTSCLPSPTSPNPRKARQTFNALFLYLTIIAAFLLLVHHRSANSHTLMPHHPSVVSPHSLCSSHHHPTPSHSLTASTSPIIPNSFSRSSHHPQPPVPPWHQPRRLQRRHHGPRNDQPALATRGRPAPDLHLQHPREASGRESAGGAVPNVPANAATHPHRRPFQMPRSQE